MAKTLVIGTRGSKLALAQSNQMAAALRAAHPGLEVELRVISTVGDRVLDVALSAVGDKGLFVKEIEAALLAGEVDLAVHSCKDLPSALPPGLTIAAYPPRADPRDALVLRANSELRIENIENVESSASDGAASARAFSQFSILNSQLLPQGAVVGTSSLRRACQLRALRPDLTLRDIRGNVDTRLRKLLDGQFDAIVLAAAGIHRLGLAQPSDEAAQTFSLFDASFTMAPLPPTTMLPAVAQGALAIEARADDAATLRLLQALDHAPTRTTTTAERAFLRRLEGGCQVPMAAYAELNVGNTIQLRGLVGALDGSRVVQGEREGNLEDAEALGIALAEDLLAKGAAALLGKEG
jgi:hydroxymethylbilane synthase